MKTYLVGGAVRDQLLQYPIKDKDYLVTGATIAEMEANGFNQVGKSFPVFLHPKTQAEYALARTEKKSGSGYTGFVCDFSPDISVEQDLERRDLTVNAMAMADDGTIIDPFNGQQDIKDKVLRHVSPAFVEDPLRVLRIAKFAARFHHLGFTVAPETQLLMTTMVETGELNALIPERIWQEMSSALNERSPSVFFNVLRDCGALKLLMPEIAALWGVPNPEKWHPEIDTGIHTMMVVDQSAKLSESPVTRFAALVHDFGKGLTPESMWPHHRGHEKTGLKPLKAFCTRLKVPNEYKDLALLMCEYHTHTHRAYELRADTIVKVFDKMDAWRKPERFSQFLLACTADMRGRTGFEERDYPQADYLAQCLMLASEVNVQDVIAEGFQGPDIRTRLTERRVNTINTYKKTVSEQV